MRGHRSTFWTAPYCGVCGADCRKSTACPGIEAPRVNEVLAGLRACGELASVYEVAKAHQIEPEDARIVLDLLAEHGLVESGFDEGGHLWWWPTPQESIA